MKMKGSTSGGGKIRRVRGKRVKETAREKGRKENEKGTEMEMAPFNNPTKHVVADKEGKYK